LNLTATIQTAIQIDISTASGGGTVIGGTGASSTGVFSIDFGNLNGLGLGSPAPGISTSVQSDGVLYSSPVTLRPYFTGFLSNNASISVYADPLGSNAAGLAAAREGTSTSAMSAISPVTPNVFTTTANNGVALTRYVGLFVGNLSGVSVLSGATNVRYIYQVVTLP